MPGGCPRRRRGGNPYKVWDLNCNQLIPMGYNDTSGFGGGPLSYMLCGFQRPKTSWR